MSTPRRLLTIIYDYLRFFDLTNWLLGCLISCALCITWLTSVSLVWGTSDFGWRREVELYGEGGVQLEKGVAHLQAQQEEALAGAAGMGDHGRNPAG